MQHQNGKLRVRRTFKLNKKENEVTKIVNRDASLMGNKINMISVWMKLGKMNPTP